MKKRLFSILLAVFVVASAIMIFSVAASAALRLPDGAAWVVNQGENQVYYRLTENNTMLYISGTGSIPDYESADAQPWSANKGTITTVYIGSEVDAIGKNAFAGCASLQNLAIMKANITVGQNAFDGCDSLSTLVVKGDYTTFKTRLKDSGSKNTSEKLIGDMKLISKDLTTMSSTFFIDLSMKNGLAEFRLIVYDKDAPTRDYGSNQKLKLNIVGSSSPIDTKHISYVENGVVYEDKMLWIPEDTPVRFVTLYWDYKADGVTEEELNNFGFASAITMMDDTQIKIGDSTFVGAYDKNTKIKSWKGIPYTVAKNGTFAAKAFEVVGSKTLNVWTTDETEDVGFDYGKRPAIVFFVTEDGQSGAGRIVEDNPAVAVLTADAASPADREAILDCVDQFAALFGASNEYVIITDVLEPARSAKNGYVSLNPSDDKTVGLTVVPNKGYRLKTLSVTYEDGSGKTQTVSPAVDSLDPMKYSFTMPAEKVNVSAEFEKILSIEELLATVEGGFPNGRYTAWLNKDATKCYLSQGKLVFEVSNTDPTSVNVTELLAHTDDDYLYEDETCIIAFKTEDGVLKGITYTHKDGNSTYAGDYSPITTCRVCVKTAAHTPACYCRVSNGMDYLTDMQEMTLVKTEDGSKYFEYTFSANYDGKTVEFYYDANQSHHACTSNGNDRIEICSFGEASADIPDIIGQESESAIYWSRTYYVTVDSFHAAEISSQYYYETAMQSDNYVYLEAGDTFVITDSCTGEPVTVNFTANDNCEMIDGKFSAKKTGIYNVSLTKDSMFFYKTGAAHTMTVDVVSETSEGPVTSSWDGGKLMLSVASAGGRPITYGIDGTYQKLTDATCTAKETGKYVVIIAEGMFAGTYETEAIEVGDFASHHLVKIDGQAATEEAAGWKDYYECKDAEDACHQYFEDEAGLTSIENLDEWKAEGGNGHLDKLTHSHNFVKHNAVSAGKDTAGCKEYYVCSCGEAYEDEARTKKIENLGEWMSVGGAGYLAPTGDNPGPGGDDPAPEGGANLWWLWVLIAVVVVGGGAAAYYFLVYKKKGNKAA